MTKTTCDICGTEVSGGFKLQVRDGEHPHNGSTMYVTIDICAGCLDMIDDLSSEKELDDLKRDLG